MTKITRDVPSHEGETIADRLKSARNDAELTQQAVADGTGISLSTVQKFESGSMDPNTTRLNAICDFIGVSAKWVFSGDSGDDVAATQETAETQVAAPVAASVAEPHTEGAPQQSEKVKMTGVEHVQSMLDDLNEIRLIGFNGRQRLAMVLMQDIKSTLRYFDHVELMDLAFTLGLYHDNAGDDGLDIRELFHDDFEQGQNYCESIEERIIDTAFFGVDLHYLEIEKLQLIADAVPDSVDLEKPNNCAPYYDDWSDDPDCFIPHVRGAFRTMAMHGILPDLADPDEYPRQE